MIIMRAFTQSALAAAISAVFVVSGPAFAASFTGQVWSGVDFTGNSPIPTTPSMQSTQTLEADLTNGVFNDNGGVPSDSIAAFTASTINFGFTGTTQTNNTFANFFKDTGKNVNNFQYIFPNSLDADINGILLSGPGKGDTFLTYISIATNFTGPAILSLSSDDASVVYVDGVQELSSNNSTADIFDVTGAGPHTVEIDYTETDGAPDSLVFSVPEPASLSIMGLGLIGLAAIRRRTR
jgi:hypothetical protein